MAEPTNVVYDKSVRAHIVMTKVFGAKHNFDHLIAVATIQGVNNNIRKEVYERKEITIDYDSAAERTIVKFQGLRTMYTSQQCGNIMFCVSITIHGEKDNTR